MNLKLLTTVSYGRPRAHVIACMATFLACAAPPAFGAPMSRGLPHATPRDPSPEVAKRARQARDYRIVSITFGVSGAVLLGMAIPALIYEFGDKTENNYYLDEGLLAGFGAAAVISGIFAPLAVRAQHHADVAKQGHQALSLQGAYLAPQLAGGVGIQAGFRLGFP